MKLTPARKRMLGLVDQQDERAVYGTKGGLRVLRTLHTLGLVQWAVDTPTGRELTAKGKEALANA